MAHPFAQYVQERFPIGPYLLLISAMVAGATAAACDAGGGPVVLWTEQLVVVAVLLLGFFHLRVFDEHKDYHKDIVAHPGRVLSRGLVTLAQLRKAAALALVLEVGLSAALGLEPLLWAGAFILFSVGMRYEFGVGPWLNRHVLVYVATHNPIVALMMIFASVAAMGRTAFPAEVLWYILVATFTSLGFEVGRKVRAPADEKPAQDTYTQSLGIPKTAILLGVFAFGSVLSALALVDHMGLRVAVSLVGVLACVATAAFARAPTARGAKLVETATTLGALAMYLLVTLDAGLRLGVAWS